MAPYGCKWDAKVLVQANSPISLCVSCNGNLERKQSLEYEELFKVHAQPIILANIHVLLFSSYGKNLWPFYFIILFYKVI